MVSNARHCGVPANALNTVVWSAEMNPKYKHTRSINMSQCLRQNTIPIKANPAIYLQFSKKMH